MNISENLQILNTAKQDIKAAIIEKGQTVGDNMHEYAEAIDNISGGGDNVDYLCFYSVDPSGSAVSLSNYGDNAPNIEYSYDKKTWTTWDYYELTIDRSQTLYFRGNNPGGFSTSNSKYSVFELVGTIYIKGDLRSLIYSQNYKNNNIIPSDYCFRQLFYNQLSVINIDDFRIGFTDANTHKWCFSYMFKGIGITSLKNWFLPALANKGEYIWGNFFGEINTLLYSFKTMPTEELSLGCYSAMFYKCANLIDAPYLPAATLNESCYLNMFNGCSSLKEAPYLPAKTLVSKCYTNMFNGCSSLQYIKAEFTTTPSTTYTGNWVNNVPSTGCFIKASDATWTTKGVNACPSGWTLITSVS